MSEDSYFYVVDGEAQPLKRVDTARLVSPARNHPMVHVGARLARSTRLSIDTETSVNHLVVRGDPQKLEEVGTYDDVGCTRCAFLDRNGHELILTDDVMVCFSSTFDDESRRNLCERLNCRVIDAKGNMWKIRVLDVGDVAPLDVANKMSEEKGVEFAEPNALQKARYLAAPQPNDDLFLNQWHLHNTGQAGGLAGADVKALNAWEVTRGNPEVRVVVHDSGVDINHPDLAANIAAGRDFDNADDDASNNFGPHGTACAGVIAAVQNDRGVVGIATGCRIVPLRAAGSHTFDVWAETFAWAAQHGDIISCSWSIGKNGTLSQAIRAAARDGREGKGIPIFCATANDAPFVSGIAYPASLPETIAVGASTNLDRRAGYSQFGEGIDFVAPSSGGTLRIETTDVQGVFGYNKTEGGNYTKAHDDSGLNPGGRPSGFGGTSSATPLAAGIAALILSENPDLSGEEVREIMRESAVKIDQENVDYGSNGWSREMGYGRLDASAALVTASNRSKKPKQKR